MNGGSRVLKLILTSLLLLITLGTPLISYAQGGNTTVIATIRDPNGALYTNSQVNITFFDPGTPGKQPLLNGSVFQTTYTIFATDSFGRFTQSIADNGIIDSSSGTVNTQWSFRVVYSDRLTSFVYSTPINCAANIPTTCIAGVIDISSQLQAVAALLPAQAGGGGSFVVRGPPCASSINFQMAGTFPTTANTAFNVSLNCNVSTSSITQAGGGSVQSGAIAQFTLTQDAIGGRSFTWPANFIDHPSIQGAALSTTNASFWYDSTNWHAQTFPASGGGAANAAGVSGDLQKNDGFGGLAVAKINDNGTTISVTEPANFTFPITSATFQSSTSNPASTGLLRLASTDPLCWRNNANSANLCLSKNTSDNLLWPSNFSINGTLIVGGSGGVATLPNNTGTIAELNLGQSWTAPQSFAPSNLLPTVAGGTDIGSTLLPFGSLWVGGAATNNFKLTGTATAARIATLPDTSFTFAGTTVPLGGTGAATFTPNGILFGNGTGAILATAASGVGTFCTVSTNGGVPTWGSCAGSAATAWSSLTNPSTDTSLAMGVNNSLFTHGIMTGARHAWEILDGNSTSTGSLWFLHTGATSTMKPFTATAQGTANGVQMTTAGVLAPIGTGGITANAWTPSLTASQLLAGNGGLISSLVGTLTGTNPVLTLTSALTTSVPFALNTPASPTADIFDININAVKTSWVDNLGIWHAPSYTATGSGALALTGTESTCPSPAGGVDILCIGNLATHTIQSSLNGAAFKDNAQFSNSGPAAHGVCLVGAIFPQLNCTTAGTSGQAFISGGAGADGSYGTLGAVGGGTGNATNTLHGVGMGEGTAALNFSAAGTAGQAFISGGAGADGAYGTFDLSLGTNTVNNLPINRGGTGAATLAAANIATVTGAITPNNCVKWSSATVITDSGGTCGGAGGSARLDQLLGGTATNTINSTIFPQVWNWALTGSTTAFKFGENTAATGASNILLQASTLNTSTAVPFQTDSNGNGYQLNSSGLFKPVGTGALATPGAAHNLIVSQAGSAAVTYIPPVAAGDVLTDNGAGVDPTFQALVVTSSKMATVNTYRSCSMVIGAENGSALVDGDIGPQRKQCQVPFAATVVEVDVSGDAGTPNVIVGKRHCTVSPCVTGANETVSNLVSGALATAASGGSACSKTGATAGLDTFTTCSATLQNTSIAVGDYIELVSGTAGGTAKRMTVVVHYTVN